MSSTTTPQAYVAEWIGPHTGKRRHDVLGASSLAEATLRAIRRRPGAQILSVEPLTAENAPQPDGPVVVEMKA